MPERAHIGLDNPAFYGRLRQTSTTSWRSPRSVSYRSRQVNDAKPGEVVTEPLLKEPWALNESSTPVSWPAAAEQAPAVVEVPKPAPAPIVAEVASTEVTESTPVVTRPAPHTRESFDQVIAMMLSQAAVFDAPATPGSARRFVVPAWWMRLKPTVRRVGNAMRNTTQIIIKDRGRSILPMLRRSPGEVRSFLARQTAMQLLILAMAVTTFAFGMAVSWETLQTNHSAAAQVAALSNGSDQSSGTNSGATSKDKNSHTAPSTVKPSAASVASYTVGPNMPRYLNIPKLGVHARVLSLGVLQNGALATPNNVYDTGWYNQSSQPGKTGAMLLDGHVSSWTAHGVFYGIKDLAAGDTLQIVRGDGVIFNYRVVKHQIFDHDKVDMQSAMRPVDPTKPGLNLITCTGDVINGTNEFNERVVVYAKQV
ncbi:MAG TPA: sortase [Candidatus Saccharimonadales bacterium]|nr:sortase [Candidatus Saccharimonadales bacterium]